MYLDTDIILALVKEEDWLKEHVNLKKIKDPKTSVFTIIEAEIVLRREYPRELSLSVLDKVKSLEIGLLPMTEKILEKSNNLSRKYPRLNVFDSVHASFSIIHKEKLISTDTIFNELEEVENIDPRDL